MANIAQKCLDHIRFDWLDEETNLFMTGSGLASIKGSREILGESLKRNVETVKSSINNLENLSMSALASVIHYWFKKNWSSGSIWDKIKGIFKK